MSQSKTEWLKLIVFLVKYITKNGYFVIVRKESVTSVYFKNKILKQVQYVQNQISIRW